MVYTQKDSKGVVKLLGYKQMGVTRVDINPLHIPYILDSIVTEYNKDKKYYEETIHKLQQRLDNTEYELFKLKYKNIDDVLKDNKYNSWWSYNASTQQYILELFQTKLEQSYEMRGIRLNVTTVNYIFTAPYIKGGIHIDTPKDHETVNVPEEIAVGEVLEKIQEKFANIYNIS